MRVKGWYNGPDATNSPCSFNSPIVYVIPYYQRTYVWNKENQWAPLWFDVVGIANQLVGATQEESDSYIPHFLGATVLKQASRPAEATKAYTVVDGQQRITTIQLLLTAAADAFRNYGILSSFES